VWNRFAISYRDRIIEMWEEKKSMEFFVEDDFILKNVFEIWSLKCANKIKYNCNLINFMGKV
jgi:hypothetical protein